MSEQAGRYQRSAGGMAGALVVLVALIGGYLAVRELTRVDPPSPVRDVDYGKVADLARQSAPFDLVAPGSLPAGWRATSVNYVDGARARWHLGLLTEGQDYVGLEQSGSSAKSMVATHVDEEAVAGEPVEVDGMTWMTWSDAGGDLALVRTQRGTTTLVVGNEVPQGRLVEFVSSLR